MRKRMVTRTIVTTNVLLMCVNPDEEKCVNISITIPGSYKDEKAMLKAIGDDPNGDGTLHPVRVVSYEELETLYGMDEKDFITHASILPPRGANDAVEE